MSFAHHLCCCYFVCNNVNYFIKQNSQLCRFLKTLQIVTSWLLIGVTFEGGIKLKTVQEFGLWNHYLLSIEKNCLTSSGTVEEEVSYHLGYYVVNFRLKITDVWPRGAGNTGHQDVSWSVTSQIRGCEPYQSVQSLIFVSTEEEPIQFFPCLLFLFSSTNIDCIRHINKFFTRFTRVGTSIHFNT